MDFKLFSLIHNELSYKRYYYQPSGNHYSPSWIYVFFREMKVGGGKSNKCYKTPFQQEIQHSTISR